MDTLRQFWRRPLRSGLLLLQVLLGTLIITLALSAILLSIKPQVSPERFNLVAGYKTETTTETYSFFYAQELSKLLGLTPDIEQLAVVSDIYEPTLVVNGIRYALRSGVRVSAGFFEIEPPNIVRGNVFTAAEAAGVTNVALLSDSAAQILFGDGDPIGQTINLETDDYNSDTPPEPPTPYRIVGTFDQISTDRFNEQPALYLPYNSFGNVNPASLLTVKSKPGQGEPARTQLLAAVRQVYSEDLKERGIEVGRDFMIETPNVSTFSFEGINQDLLTFSLFGIISLVVSSIGIFSAAVFETEERTREIGIRRAIGASVNRINRNLIGRSLAVALLGGILGVLSAALIIPILRGPAKDAALFGGIQLTFEPLAAIIALGTVTFVSGLLGLVPAFSVANLKPVEALRDS